MTGTRELIFSARKINEIAEELQYLRSIVGERSAGNQLSNPSRTSYTAPHQQNPEPLLTPTSVALYPQTGTGELQRQYRGDASLPAQGLQAWETIGSDPQPSLDTRHVSSTTSSSRCLENVELSGAQVDDLFCASVL